MPDLSLWSIALAGVGITVFTLAVTFLGDAIQRAKLEEELVKQRKKDDFQLRLTDLQNKVNQFRESSDDSAVKSTLKEITRAQKKHDRDLRRIQNKYNSLHFIQSIAFPGTALIGAFLFSELSKSQFVSTKLSLALWTLALGLIAFAGYKIVRCLLLVQEISLSSKDQKTILMEAFQEALAAHEEETTETLGISFPKLTFPLKTKPDTELKISFRTIVLQGKITHNTEAWFFIPDGFEIIDPPEKDSWRQDDDFVVPKIRTVQVTLGDVIKSTYTSGSITVKTPKVEGTFFLLHRLKADECSSGRGKLEIQVAA